MQLHVWQVLSRRLAFGYLRKALVAWQDFSFHDLRPGELLCYTDADSRRSTSGGVVTLGGGVLNCWAKKQKSVALSS